MFRITGSREGWNMLVMLQLPIHFVNDESIPLLMIIVINNGDVIITV